MGLHIADDRMSSDATPHTARKAGSTWEVSWLPGRVLDRNQAVSAMMIAVTVSGTIQPGDTRWLHAADWAAELGLEVGEAILMVLKPPPGTAR